MAAVVATLILAAPLVIIATGAFVAMEAVSYATHRWVMHGLGMVLHRSHHTTQGRGLEANDAFPVVFASLAVLLFAAGTAGGRARAFSAVAAGVTAYGAAYGWVHDIYIHRRLPLARHRYRVLERLAEAHELHHRFGGEPYGMLLPVVPRALRLRATARPRQDAGRPSAVAAQDQANRAPNPLSASG